MNPLAAYLLSVVKNEEHDATRRFQQHSMALAELGYWLMWRPVGTLRKDMPATRIVNECEFIETFLSRYTGYEGYDGFDVAIDVYADPRVVDFLG